MCVYVCVCVCLCVSMCVYVRACVCMCLHENEVLNAISTPLLLREKNSS